MSDTAIKITLKAARINAGYTQKRAAEVLGISKDTLWNYESGRTYPDVEIISDMLRLYNIGYDSINFFSNKKRFNRNNTDGV